jgi:hypothetical protein
MIIVFHDPNFGVSIGIGQLFGLIAVPDVMFMRYIPASFMSPWAIWEWSWAGGDVSVAVGIWWPACGSAGLGGASCAINDETLNAPMHKAARKKFLLIELLKNTLSSRPRRHARPAAFIAAKGAVRRSDSQDSGMEKIWQPWWGGSAREKFFSLARRCKLRSLYQHPRPYWSLDARMEGHRGTTFLRNDGRVCAWRSLLIIV